MLQRLEQPRQGHLPWARPWASCPPPWPSWPRRPWPGPPRPPAPQPSSMPDQPTMGSISYTDKGARMMGTSRSRTMTSRPVIAVLGRCCMWLNHRVRLQTSYCCFLASVVVSVTWVALVRIVRAGEKKGDLQSSCACWQRRQGRRSSACGWRRRRCPGGAH